VKLVSDRGAVRKAAFVVVDLQNDYCHPDGVYPRNALTCFSIDGVISATVSAVRRARQCNIPVIYVRMLWRTDAHGYPIDAGLIVEHSRPFLRTEGLRRGTWGAELVRELPLPDYEVEKTRYSGFHNTTLEPLLRGLGVETILLAGVITNMCVEATARDAFHRDFRVVVLRDCVSGFSRELHDSSLKTMSIFTRVETSDYIFDAYGSARTQAAVHDA
jgi:ureidoacrylate peracid hydrolase